MWLVGVGGMYGCGQVLLYTFSDFLLNQRLQYVFSDSARF